MPEEASNAIEVSSVANATMGRDKPINAQRIRAADLGIDCEVFAELQAGIALVIAEKQVAGE